MDRLFGKELSNLLSHNASSRQRNQVKLQSRSTRGNTLNDIKVGNIKTNKSLVSQNNSMRAPKIERMHEEKQNKEDTRNVQMVPEYFDECLGFMLQEEEKKYNLANYMPAQTIITEKMRGILIDWIADLHSKFKMFPQTLYMIIMIIDKYLSTKGATKENLQLVGTAAFFIAAKYEETYQVPEVGDLVHFAADAFSRS